MQDKTYLLEIGTEELPAGVTDNLISSLSKFFGSELDKYQVEKYKLTTYSTPRRLAICIENLPLASKEYTEFVAGPSPKAPEQAIQGFMRKHNITNIEQLIEQDNRLCAKKTINAIDIKDILKLISKEAMNILITSGGNKLMHWNTGQYSFVRPVRWIVNMLDSEIIELNAFGLDANNTTRPNRILENNQTNCTQYIQIQHAGMYNKLLFDNKVIASPFQRKAIITKSLQNISNKLNIYIDSQNNIQLIDEIIELLEYPEVLIGEFDHKYLELPKFIIETILKNHQRYIPCYTDSNCTELSNKFIFVANCLPNAQTQVIQGNQKVIIARLDDGEFSINEDLNNTFESLNKQLADMTFQKELGSGNSSMLAKTHRLVNISQYIINNTSILSPDNQDDLLQASKILKADLASQTVYEFPELQGLTGGYIAKSKNYNNIIANAISEQYLPLSQGGQLPSNIVGAVLSLIDKADNLISLFVINKIPSGSADPFALRRQTQGIVEIFIKYSEELQDFSINNLCEITVKTLDSNINYDEFLNTIHKKKFSLKDFIIDRLKTILCIEYPKNIIDSIINSDSLALPVHKLLQSIKNIQSQLDNNLFIDLIASLKRINNLLKNKSLDNLKLNTDSLVLDLDRELLNIYKQWQDSNKSWSDIYLLIPVINNFLDNTLINNPDDIAGSEARQVLLYSIYTSISQECGVSQWDKLS